MYNLALRGVTMTTSKAGLTAGTTTTFTTANAVDYCINGNAYTKAAQTNTATPTTDIVTGKVFKPVEPGNGSVFVFGWDAAGNVRVAQGEIMPITDETNGANAEFEVLPEFPNMPDDFSEFGYVHVKVGTSGAAWTFGSSNLAGPPSNVSFTFKDVMKLPARPKS